MSVSDPGVAEYTALVSLITGNVAFGIAIIITAIGLYLWLVKQNTKGGLVMIIAGALISLTPNLLDGMRVNFCPLVTDLGGSCGSTTNVYTGAAGSALPAAGGASVASPAAPPIVNNTVNPTGQPVNSAADGLGL